VRTSGLRWLVATALAVLAATSVWAGTVNGTIKNGTDGKPGANLDVILIQLQGGMQPVQTVKSDAQGHFKFDNPQLGQAPMLIRVPFKGVNYHTPAPPGTANVEVEIFNPTDKESAVEVTQHDIVVQPSGETMMIGEEYTVENKTQPPVAFYRNEGTFTFSIPAGAQLSQVSAWSAAGMPVTQGTIDRGKNASAIAFPFRPGKNGVRIAYTVPYPGNHASVSVTSPYAVQGVFLVAPPQLQVSGAGFSANGQQDGYNIFGHDGVGANTALTFSVSGTAPPPQDNANAGGGGGGAAGAGGADGGANDPSVNSRAGGAGETVTAMPGRLDSLKWILVGGFALLFVLGIAFLWKKPGSMGTVAVAGGGTVSTAALPARESRGGERRRASDAAGSSAYGSAPAPASGASAQGMDEVNREVRGGLDELKERLFKLELRHQAGTISDEDYARSRAQVEQTLRELVRG
jgi:hypothetical protein